MEKILRMTTNLLYINISSKAVLVIVILKDQEVLIHSAKLMLNGMLGIQLKDCLKLMPKKNM